MSMINQEVIANIMNAVNGAINDLGYVAVGYDNTHMFLNIIIEPNNLVEEEMTKPDVIYICKGEGMTCFLHPGCVYREDPVSATDWVCNHTMKPECAKYGACEDPENHPERFTFQERSDSCAPSYYWEEDVK